MSFKPHPLHLVLGFTLWFVYFNFVYGGMSVGCSFSDARDSTNPLNWINLFVLGATVVFNLAFSWAAWKCHQVTPAEPIQARFFARLSAVLYAMAAFSTLVVGAAALIYPPCL